jgi:tetratricopeptide (TPR) repeat protein
VSQYRLTSFDPFSLELSDKSSPEGAARAATELARANAIYPGGTRLRVFEGALALERGDVDGALRIAGEVSRLHPDRPEPLRLRGDALLRRERFAEAAEAYEGALARGGDTVAQGQLFYLESRLWACYVRLGRKDDAYRAMKRALGNLYDPEVGYRELASLGGSALDAGHTAEGKSLLEFALAKTPPNETELRRSIETRLRSLSLSP